MCFAADALSGRVTGGLRNINQLSLPVSMLVNAAALLLHVCGCFCSAAAAAGQCFHLIISLSPEAKAAPSSVKTVNVLQY